MQQVAPNKSGARRISRKARAMDGASPSERLMDRVQDDAEKILENVLHRRRWLVADRDAVAKAILAVVDRELRLAARAAIMS